jgi:hypothetical protein
VAPEEDGVAEGAVGAGAAERPRELEFTFAGPVDPESAEELTPWPATLRIALIPVLPIWAL